MARHPTTNARGDKWDFYKDDRGEWKWRRILANGAVLGTSHLSFKNKEDCISDIGSLLENIEFPLNFRLKSHLISIGTT